MKIRGNTIGTTEKKLSVQTLVDSLGFYEISRDYVLDKVPTLFSDVELGEKLLIKIRSNEYWYQTVVGQNGDEGIKWGNSRVIQVDPDKDFIRCYYIKPSGAVTLCVATNEGLTTLYSIDKKSYYERVPIIENTTGSNAVYYTNKNGVIKLFKMSSDPNNNVIVMRPSGKDTFGNDDSGELRVRKKSQLDAGELMPKTDYVAICKAQADQLYASKTDLENALGSYIEEIDTLLGGD